MKSNPGQAHTIRSATGFIKIQKKRFHWKGAKMNGAFFVSDFSRKSIIRFIELLKSKDLTIRMEWLKNAKAISTEEQSMPDDANGLNIFINDRPGLLVGRRGSHFNDKELSPPESKRVLEALFEIGWLSKPEFSSGLCCSFLHFIVLALLISSQWGDPSRSLLITLCILSIALIALGIAMWVPMANRGLKPSTYSLVLLGVGIFFTIPSSLLHIVLAKALLKKAFYVSAVRLFPDLATISAKVETEPETQTPTYY